MRPHPGLAIALLPSLVACATASITTGGDGSPAVPRATAPAAPVPLADYFQARRLSGLCFSHDERTVVYASDEGGRLDLWARPLDALGPAGRARATQLTHLAGTLEGFRCSPTDDRIAYEADVGGDELPHLFLTNLRGEAPRDLTADYPAGRRVRLIDFGRDGKTILFLSSLRDERYLDLYELDLTTGKASRLWEASGSLSVDAVSFDHRRFVVSETLSDADTNLYLVERNKPGRVLLTPHAGEVTHQAASFSRDGRTLYLTTDGNSEFMELAAVDLGGLDAALTGAAKIAPPVMRQVKRGAWDLEGAWVSWSGKYLATVENADGTPHTTVHRGEAGPELALPAPPPGAGFDPIGFSRSDRYLAVRLASDTSPSTPWILDLERGTASALDDALPETLRRHPMVVGESVRIPSFDGKPVPALLYRPAGTGPFPALIDVHGGPTAQSRREFARHRQYLASKGYLVLVPNVRGSTGYGKSWMRMDNKDLGGGPLKDILACKGYLVREAHADTARVAIQGGSYGGYMTLAAATFAPTEFAAHVDFFGVSDLKSLVESFPPYWAAYATYIYKKFGDPKDPADAAYQHDRSPAYFLDRVERPLLVVQGDRDPRVKKDQSDRVVEALKKRGVPVHYLVIPDEGHGFSKTENFRAALEAADRFLDRYLFGDTSRPVLP